MAVDKTKLEKAVRLDRLDLDLLRKKASDPAKDMNGLATRNLASSLRRIGVADYIINGDKDSFRMHLKEAVLLSKRLFDRFDADDAISPSFVSMLSYKKLFDALAVGDIELARGLAEKMGGRDSVESEYDHPFDRALGYTLKSFTLNDTTTGKHWLAEFITICADGKNADFWGYCDVFDGIQEGGHDKAQKGLNAIVQGHKNQCKGGGVFKDTEDELLSVWGLGVANLARMRGLMVETNDPLIPTSLLV